MRPLRLVVCVLAVSLTIISSANAATTVRLRGNVHLRGTVGFARTFPLPTYTSAQTATTAVAVSKSTLLSILNHTAPNTPFLNAYGQLAPDSTNASASADVLKIVQTTDVAHPYLGVYHHYVGSDLFEADLAYSTDLSNWTLLGRINFPAAMPDLRILSDNSVLVAMEANPSGVRPYIEVFYYSSLASFIAAPGSPTRQVSLPLTAGATADGTPNFGVISYNGNILISSIEITYHYFASSTHDQEGAGTLYNFSTFTSNSSTWLNNAFAALGYNDIGGRSVLRIATSTYMIVEARPSVASGFGAWRVFLVDPSKNITLLSPVLTGGAYSLGNPKVSYITLPDGRPALYVGYFVFSEGANATPAGQHVFIYPLTQ